MSSPILASRELCVKSGYQDKYDDNMFPVHNHSHAIKTMNCPFHLNIFNHIVHAYRDLPYGLAEFGLCIELSLQELKVHHSGDSLVKQMRHQSCAFQCLLLAWHPMLGRGLLDQWCKYMPRLL